VNDHCSHCSLRSSRSTQTSGGRCHGDGADAVLEAARLAETEGGLAQLGRRRNVEVGWMVAADDHWSAPRGGTDGSGHGPTGAILINPGARRHITAEAGVT
jgi:hypothetical protein